VIRRRRRLAFLAVVAGLFAVAIGLGLGPFKDAVKEITLPLRHEDIIRQQAKEKNLDPALIAGVIYEESKFRDATSHAGARGLMQITPDTARFIAHRTGGTAFEIRDLANPDINIRYGSWYLRWLLDHYDGRTALALAAYNGGIGNVDKWVAKAGGPDAFDHVSDIPFPETENYVRDVLERQREYRRAYSRELGI
jgi:soluble lytic murein transglycosylase